MATQAFISYPRRKFAGRCQCGLFQHRRVNDPELENKTRTDGDTRRTRSVSLSSERLGITGKLDRIEEVGGRVYPVETKRGSAPRDAEARGIRS